MAGRERFKEHKKKRERGGFVTLPYILLRSDPFVALSAHAKALLLDLLAQYKGDNNGDLCLAWSVMKLRGWKSEATLNKAKRELLAKDFIMVTRQGGKHRASLYALTFYSIDECKGKLDVPPTHSPPGTWRRYESLSALKMPEQQKPYYATRSNSGTITTATVPISSDEDQITTSVEVVDGFFEEALLQQA